MDYTLGEIVVETFQPTVTPLPLTYTILTQGFHQGILKVTTSVENIDIKTKVYPNPTTNFLIVELEKNVKAVILVYDINGKLVIKDKLNDENQKQFDFSFLKQGNYFLHINIADKQSVHLNTYPIDENEPISTIKNYTNKDKTIKDWRATIRTWEKREDDNDW